MSAPATPTRLQRSNGRRTCTARITAGCPAAVGHLEHPSRLRSSDAPALTLLPSTAAREPTPVVVGTGSAGVLATGAGAAVAAAAGAEQEEEEAAVVASLTRDKKGAQQNHPRLPLHCKQKRRAAPDEERERRAAYRRVRGKFL